MPRILLLAVGLLLALLGGPARAQRRPALPPVPDSLRGPLHRASTPHARGLVYTRIGTAYSQVRDSAGALGYHRAAEQLGRQLHDSLLLGRALTLRADYYTGVLDYRRAAPLAAEAEPLLRHAPAGEYVSCLTVLGECYGYGLNQPLRGMRYLRRALALNRRLHDTIQVGHVLHRAGILYTDAHRADSARYYLLAARRTYAAAHDSLWMMGTYTTLGRLALQQLHYAEAAAYLRPALRWQARHADAVRQAKTLVQLGRLARAQDSLPASVAYLHQAWHVLRRTRQATPLASLFNELGQTYALARRPDSAEYYLRRAVTEQTRLGPAAYNRGRLLVALATFYQQQHRADAAEQTAREALAIDGGRPNAAYTADAWQVLQAVAEHRGRFAQAYQLVRRTQHLRDSLRAQENQELSEDLRIRYQTAQAEQRVRLLTQRQELTRLRTQRNLLALTAALVLAVAGGGGLLWRYRRRQAAREEALRTRLAADLHDDVGTLLSQISMQSSLLELGLTSADSQREQLSQISEASRSAVRQLNDVVWSLDAHNDQLPNLLDRMRDYAHEVLGAAGLDVRFEAPASLPVQRLPVLVRRNLYLIYKEALHNVLKHARRATRVTVSLALTESHRLVLNIADDGQPAAPAAGPADEQRRTGHGLRNISQRAAAVGGEATASSGAAGFRLRVQVPLPGGSARLRTDA